ncbi:MAG: hypothetical protein IJQ07_04100 [Clostridia bacterium]|nr:hypothetical protein [Clostridia bacterium]
MEQFTFYDMYYDAIGQLNDEEAGKFIKRICNYALYDTEDTPSKDDIEIRFSSIVNDKIFVSQYAINNAMRNIRH